MLTRLAIFWLSCALFLNALASTPLRAAAAIEFTAAESAWLQNHPEITVGYTPEWLPYSTAASNRLLGIDAEIIALIENRTGLKIAPITRSSWAAIYELGTQRKIDVLIATEKTAARSLIFNFTIPYDEIPVIILTRHDFIVPWSLENLAAAKAASPAGWYTTELLQSLMPPERLIQTNTSDEAMRLVATGEADGTLAMLPNATHFIKTSGYTNLRVSGILPDPYRPRYAVRPDWPELTSILNKVILSITPAERQQIQSRWIKVDYAPALRWDFIWLSIAALTVIFSLLVGGLILRHRHLSSELALRQKLLAELEQSKNHLDQLNDDKTLLLRMLLHDLRSPLTALSLHLELVSEKPTLVPADLRPLSDGLRQINHFLNSFLESRAFEQGRSHLRTERIAPASFTINLVQTLAEAARVKQIQLHTIISPDLPDAVSTSPQALTQVITNLLTNAIKYSPAGTEITLTLTRTRTHLRYTIQDQGPGVPANEREQIFTPYRRGSTRPTAGETSTGLGLSISRHLCRQLGGDLWLENSQPGATFVFEVTLEELPHATAL